MFQNISKDFIEEQEELEKNSISKKQAIWEVLKKIFSKKNIIIYVIGIMVSQVSFGGNNAITPFGVAFIVAMLSNCMPIGVLSIAVTISTLIRFGPQNGLNVIFAILLILGSIVIKAPKYEEKKNERRKLTIRLFMSTLIINIISIFFKEFVIYDILLALMYSICACIFYKIFVNGIDVITNIGEKKIYSIEEVMSASLILAVAISCLGELNVFGYSVKNILCILIVLIMGWKNGILVGATSGITIGTVLGVIGDASPILIASFALSGMIAGIFNKLGKIGVIVGFILGNLLLTYVYNGNTVPIILIQEILIASLGLLAVPKNIKINIQDLNNEPKLLPETTGRNLEENKETIYKLNSMSETIFDIARSYKEAAATIVDEEELKKQEEENIETFEKELQNNLEGLENNILYEDISSLDDDMLKELFEKLLENEKIERKDLLSFLEKHNSYIVGSDLNYINDDVEADIKQILKAINDAYKVNKVSFIWKKKLDENKKTVSNQLEEVSKAIGKLAQDIEEETSEEFFNKEKQIKKQLEEKDIYIEDLHISKEESGKLKVDVYTKVCENVESPTCNTKKMGQVISKITEQKMVLQKQECGIRLKQDKCLYTYTSEDKMKLTVGIAKTTKKDSEISGDTSIQTKLDDGKYLLALSDGMGSGKEARKSSRMVIGMLERLLSSGFDKDTSVRLINSSLQLTSKDDMYSTLDMTVLDLYEGKLEFIKNGACPTYIKNRRNVEILKSLTLPTGIMDEIDLVVYDKELNNGDIIVMCSDGVIDSSSEYTNKELWLKFLLEEIETDDVQKIADIIINEAIDNGFGTAKDDMTVLVAKVNSK